jgi:hypothetical protein
MTVIVGTNSYIDEAELIAYALARGVTITEPDATVLLIKSMDYLESQSFIGVKTSTTQALQWPRTGAYIDGVLVDPDTVPQEVKDAESVIAMSIQAGYDPLATYGPAVKSEKVDVIQITYKDSSSTTDYNPNITRALSKITTGFGAGSGLIEVNAAR